MIKITNAFVDFLRKKLPTENINPSYQNEKTQYPQIIVDCVKKSAGISKSRFKQATVEILVENLIYKDKDKNIVNTLMTKVDDLLNDFSLESELSNDELEVLFINFDSVIFDPDKKVNRFMFDVEIFCNAV